MEAPARYNGLQRISNFVCSMYDLIRASRKVPAGLLHPELSLRNSYGHQLLLFRWIKVERGRAKWMMSRKVFQVFQKTTSILSHYIAIMALALEMEKKCAHKIYVRRAIKDIKAIASK